MLALVFKTASVFSGNYLSKPLWKQNKDLIINHWTFGGKTKQSLKNGLKEIKQDCPILGIGQI